MKRSLWAVRLQYDSGNASPMHVLGLTAEEAIAKRRAAALAEIKAPGAPKRPDLEINALLAVDGIVRVHFIDIE